MAFVNSDLEIIYNYYKELLAGNISTKNDQYNSEWINDNFTYFLIDFYNKNKFPRLVSDATFDSNNKAELYHGFKKYEHGASYLWDYVYHYGDGTYGSGLYVTDDWAEACDYGSVFCSYIAPLRVKLDTENYIELDLLDDVYASLQSRKEDISKFSLDEDKEKRYRELLDFINKQPDGDNFVHFLTRNTSSLAVYLGFDAVKHFFKTTGKYHMIVLNRNSIIFPERDFRRFMLGAGGEYKNHYLNNYIEVDDEHRYTK